MSELVFEVAQISPMCSVEIGNRPEFIRSAATFLQTTKPSHQRIAIPAHKPLRIGTFSAILRTIAQHKKVTREEIINTL